MLNRLAIVFSFLILFAAGPAIAGPPLEVYGRLPDVEIVSISPSGDRYAIAGRVQEGRAVLIVEGERVVESIDVTDEKVRDLDWAGDDFLLITSTRTYDLRMIAGTRYEIAHVGIVDLKNKTLKFALSKGDAQNGVWGSYGVRQIDGRWYGFFGGMTMDGDYLQSGHPDLYRVDLETGDTRLVDRGGREDFYRSWLVGPDGEIAAVSEYRDRGQWRLLVGGREVVRAEDPFSDFGVVGFGRQEGSLLYRGPGGEGWGYFEVDGEGRSQELEFDADSYSLTLDPYTRKLIGWVSYDGRAKFSFDSAGRQARSDRIEEAFSDRTYYLPSWSRDFNKIIAFTEGAEDPGTYWLVDFTTGETRPIGYAYANISPEEVAPNRLVRYRAQDGLEIEAVLTLPPGREARDLPVVVLPHGGPRSRDWIGFDWMAQAFASRGYAVFQPNFRGSTGYGDDFIDAGRGEWGRKMQTDVSDGLSWLIEQGIADGERACVLGGSYGGYVALAGVTLQNGLYRCAVAFGAVADLPEMIDFDTRYSGNDTRRYWLDYIGPRAVLRDLSPSQHAADANAPVLLIHGRNDTVVPYTQAEIMNRALSRAGKDVELVTLESEDHWLSTSETRQQMLEAAVAFVERHNPP